MKRAATPGTHRVNTKFSYPNAPVAYKRFIVYTTDGFFRETTARIMNIDRRLTELIKPHRAPFFQSLLAGTLSSFMLVGQAALLSRIIDGAFVKKSAPGALSAPLLFFALFSLLRMLFSWLAQNRAKEGTVRIKQELFTRLCAGTGSLGPQFAGSVRSGSLSTTLTKGVEALDQYFSQYMPQLYFALATPLLILAAVMTADPVSALTLLLSAPLIPLFMVLIGKSAGAMTDRQWNTMSRMSGYFLDMLQGLTTLKLFARSREQRRAIEEAGESFRHATMQVLKIAFLSSLALELTGTIGMAVIAVGIGMRLLEGQLAFQAALFVLLLTPDFYLPLRQLGLKFHAGKEGVSASKEIFALLDRVSGLPPSGSNELPEQLLRNHDIVFDKVSYTYPGAAAPALKQLTCTFPAGRTTAITGPSGAGKSTMASLLLRFMEPSEGSVKIAGNPIDTLSGNSWLQHLSWVPQQPFLFNGSIRENLRLAKPGAGEDELNEAISMAGLGDLVQGMPEGLDTKIGEQGTRLSGGEAQRIALARAFLKNAPVLVLDEPTSNTDPLLERSLRAAMKTLMRGRTVIIIAHRQETVRDADSIIVLQNGSIAQSGSHVELAGAKGYYAALHRQLPEDAA